MINKTALDFIVLNIRTGNAIAAFMLPSHAKAFIEYLRKKEGPHGPIYEVVNSDGTATISKF